MSQRPEHSAPPELFYNQDEARKYTENSRIMNIQVAMCERALELLALPEDETCMVLDIGCGSGLSGSVLEEQGHFWIGVDISTAMLSIALEREVEGELVLGDMGQGMPFKAGTFDGVVSISALQWICNIDKNVHSSRKRLQTFFSTLFSCLTTGARAVFQFYPENEKQVEIITSAASKAGFAGGLVVDFPNSKKAKKIFLVLMTSGLREMPQALTEQCPVGKRQEIRGHGKKGKRENFMKCKKTWIMKKKEQFRKQGKKVKNDSKFSGRKRNTRF